MIERQIHHPDNELADDLIAEKTPSQQGSAGGNVARRVGK